MTREEEIMKAARVYANGIAQHLPNKKYCEEDFSTGAEWADRTMIEKACRWLNKHLDNYNISWIEDEYCWSKEMFLKQFKQAMKGE